MASTVGHPHQGAASPDDKPSASTAAGATANKKKRARPLATAAGEHKKRRRDMAGAMATPPRSLAVEGRYQKLEAIGKGAYGIVYRARDRHTCEIVAMKCLRRDMYDDDHHLDFIFDCEVSALKACLGLPSVVQLRDSRRHNAATGVAIIVMEFVGTTLKMVTMGTDGEPRRHGEDEVRGLVRQLLAGAASMHRAGLMHRDIKPDNVLVDARGGLKFCDLGISRALADTPPFTNPVVARRYRAPELLLGSTDYDALIDTWAIGCIMAELLASCAPFGGCSSVEEHLGKVLDVLGTDDIKEWSGCPERLPGGCGPNSLLRDLFPCPEKAVSTGRPLLSEAGFEVLSGLLRCNPNKRMTATRALKHRWFRSRMLGLRGLATCTRRRKSDHCVELE